MRTGCSDCDHIQIRTGDKTRLCNRCELQLFDWIEAQIKKRRKHIMSERTKMELQAESEVQNVATSIR